MFLSAPIKEDFLHYLWKTKRIDFQDLKTTDGQSLEIIEFGVHNSDSGPDFFNGKVKIKNTVWAGNIEMHINSSDWYKHRHEKDDAYKNVILHVVYENDREVVMPDGSVLPCLELKGKIPKIILNNYLKLSQSNDWIACEKSIGDVNTDKIELWKYKLIIDRFERKTDRISELLKEHNNDWEQTLFVLLARYFGAKINVEPFERMARSIPLQLVLKNKDKANTLDALFFGQAGMLKANYTDEYFVGLKTEYAFQQKKYQLTPIDPVAWKFSRLRPPNFPTVRIAQFSAIIHYTASLFSKIKSASNAAQIRKFFIVKPDSYWDQHYRFGVLSNKVEKSLSTSFIDLLIINAVAPMLFQYGKSIGDEDYTEKAIQLLETIPAEKNNITKHWNALGIKSTSAFDSQSLIHLKTEYCDHKRCLSCSICYEILGRS